MARLAACIAALLAFSVTATSAPENAHYVGSKVCSACHPAIYRSFVKTDMGRSIRLANELDQATIPSEASVPVPSSTRILRVFRDSEGWHQLEADPNVFVDEHKLEYAIGSGANGLTFLVRRGTYLFQAPLSFYSRIGKWDLSPGYQYSDYGFGRPIAQQCLLCHSGRPKPVDNRNGEYLDPPFQELAIGCENCHGPGEVHAKSAGKLAGSIVNPAKLASRLAESICINCHQSGDTRILLPGKSYFDFQPGQWLIDTLAIFKVPPNPAQQNADLLEHYSAMILSRCFRESAGRLSCLTCHDPHVQPREPEQISYFRQKCLTCHTDQSCRLPKQTRLKQTPPDDCSGCHMPKRNVAVISHSALTNHRIPARSDELPSEPAPADPTGLILVNGRPDGKQPLPEITLLRAYSELAGQNAAYQQRYLKLLDHLSQTQPGEPFVQAALGHRALAEGKNQEALAHLSGALQLGDAMVYRDMAQALKSLNRDEEALEYLKRAAGLEPFDATIRKTLILEYINLKRYPEARQAMQEYVGLFPEDSFMRGLLARVSN